MLSKGIDNSNEFKDGIVYNYNSLNNEDFIDNINYESLGIIDRINEYIKYIKDRSYIISPLYERYDIITTHKNMSYNMFYFNNSRIHDNYELLCYNLNTCLTDEQKNILIDYLSKIKNDIVDNIFDQIKYYINVNFNEKIKKIKVDILYNSIISTKFSIIFNDSMMRFNIILGLCVEFDYKNNIHVLDNINKKQLYLTFN